MSVPVTTQDEIACSNQQHRALIAMQVLNCETLDVSTNADDERLRSLAKKVLIRYLAPSTGGAPKKRERSRENHSPGPNST